MNAGVWLVELGHAGEAARTCWDSCCYARFLSEHVASWSWTVLRRMTSRSRGEARCPRGCCWWLSRSAHPGPRWPQRTTSIVADDMPGVRCCSAVTMRAGCCEQGVGDRPRALGKLRELVLMSTRSRDADSDGRSFSFGGVQHQPDDAEGGYAINCCLHWIEGWSAMLSCCTAPLAALAGCGLRDLRMCQPQDARRWLKIEYFGTSRPEQTAGYAVYCLGTRLLLRLLSSAPAALDPCSSTRTKTQHGGRHKRHPLDLRHHHHHPLDNSVAIRLPTGPWSKRSHNIPTTKKCLPIPALDSTTIATRAAGTPNLGILRLPSPLQQSRDETTHCHSCFPHRTGLSPSIPRT